MSLFCFHAWGKPEGRYQQCVKCGKARPLRCSHLWDVDSSTNVFSDGSELPVRFEKTLRCRHCGDFKLVKL